MGVNVEWRLERDNRTGIVAEGTYLWDAAKRLGVRLPAECEGRGQCDTCAVIVEQGATLLSSLTDAERERLSPERLAAGERLACQTKVEHGGDLVLRPVPQTERAETTDESVKDIRREFSEMPLQKKLSTLAELEAVAAYEAVVKLVDLPFTIIEKGLDLMAGRGRTLAQREREARRPAEHRTAARSAPVEDKTDGRSS
ncbi:MAG TPA: 2Fe-2S iron-sulfur cluster-binding protein [Pyrinomonadaceae bacterium]|nr:2Fe-2S iron-sulfur cluster-binding protein [Pyrinomonadaceae bacterium]